MKKKDVAIVIENLIQFQYIENGINTLLNNGISLDIYVPTSKYANGFDDLFDNTYNYLLKNNYEPKRYLDDTIYKILLEPYPTDKYFKINSTYRIKFPYSLIAAKPDPSFRPDWNIYYDAILCHSKYEASYLKVYSETLVVGPLKSTAPKELTSKEKPTLLYLPTYGELSSIDELIDVFNTLKEKYNIIIKFHHGTSFLNTEKDRLERLKSLVTECYDSNTNLSELLSKSDVVLSDNSGAIFEALYNDIPVAIFARNINKKLSNFNTIQYDLVQSDILPYTNSPKDITKILSLACSSEYKEKQHNIKEQLFYISKNGENEFLEIIKNYLNDNINLKYKQLHDVLINDYISKINLITNITQENKNISEEISKRQDEIKSLKNINIQSQNEITSLNNKIQNQNNILYEQSKLLCEYTDGLLYKIAKKMYNIYFKIFKKISK